MKRLIDKFQGTIIEETFLSDITLSVQIKVEDLEAIQSDVSELTSGSVRVEVVSTNPGTIMPLKHEP
ncbi:MAG: DUF1949 domain-containing protein [Anaerolineaceae bacterium]|nr:DUF1949 domain-containing protein [Anaerolineaceae bacterium]